MQSPIRRISTSFLTTTGAYAITATVTDKDGGQNSDTVEINATNANPGGTISGVPDGQTFEGSPINLHVDGSDAGSADVSSLTYSWSVTEGENNDPVTLPDDTDTSSADFTFTPVDDGTYTATVHITDKDGGSADISTDPIVVSDAPPSVSISGQDTPVTENATLPAGAADSVNSNGNTFHGNATAWFLQSDGEGYASAGIMKWQLPDGLTSDEVDSASLKLFIGNTTSAQVNLYAFDSNSSTVSAADYSAATASTTIVASNIMAAAGQYITISNQALSDAIKSALDNGRNYVSFAARFASNPPNVAQNGWIEGPQSNQGSGEYPSLSLDITLPIVEGSTTTLTANVTDPGVNDTFTYAWTVTKDDQPYDTGETPTDQPTFDFMPDDNGDYVVTSTVTDNGGAAGLGSVEINVLNVNPTGTISGAPSGAINEGDTVSLTANPSDAGAADTNFTYAWSVMNGEDAVTLPDGTDTSSAGFTFVAPDHGSYVATVRITDKDGGFTDVSTDPITVNNVAPTATITGAPASETDSSATLPSGSEDTVNDSHILFNVHDQLLVGEAGPGQLWTSIMNWQLPEGLTADNVSSATLVLHADSSTTRQVNLYTFDSASRTVAGSDYDDVNAATTIVQSNILSGSNQTVTISNTALTDAIKAAITAGHDYVSFAVRLADNTVQENLDVGWFDGPTAEVSANRPTLTIGTAGPATVVEGSTTTLTAGVTDPGTQDTFTYAWSVTKDNAPYDLGDEATDQPTFDFTPNDNGAYVVSLAVTDKDGGSNTATQDITVTNANPTGTISGLSDAPQEGTPISLSVDASDPGSADIAGLTYSWAVTKNSATFDLPDGTDTSSSNFTFTPDDNGLYNATVTITDKDGGQTDVSTGDFSVANVTPTATVTGIPDSFPEGTQETATANVTDPGIHDTFTYVWHYYKNDGQNMVEVALPADAQFSDNTVTWTPDDNGLYGWYVSVTDNDGANSLNPSPTFTVTNANPSGTISGQPDGDINEGDTVQLTANGTDPGAADVASLTYSWAVTTGDDVPFTLPEGTDTSSAGFSFVPTDNGTYIATVTITDKDGGHSDVSTDPITVTNVAPTGTITGQPEGDVNEGDTVQLTANGADVGAADVASLTYSLERDQDRR